MMSQIEHYQIVLADTEKKIVQLEAECYELESQLEMRRSLIAEAEYTKSFIQNTLLPEAAIKEKPKTDFELSSHDHRTAIEKLQEWKETAKLKQYSETNESSITLGDGSEVILEVHGSSLHADRIADELQEIGRFKATKNVTGTLKTDGKKRFINLGQNIWDLRKRHEGTKDTEEVKDVEEVKQQGE
jgi:hypothetical protein